MIVSVPSVGFIAQGLSWITFAFGSLSAAWVANNFGVTHTMKVVAWAYPFTVLVMITQSTVLLVLTNALVGFAGANLWISQGIYLSKLCHKEPEKSGVLNGLFFGLALYANRIIGNLIIKLLLLESIPIHNVIICMTIVCALGSLLFLFVPNMTNSVGDNIQMKTLKQKSENQKQISTDILKSNPIEANISEQDVKMKTIKNMDVSVFRDTWRKLLDIFYFCYLKKNRPLILHVFFYGCHSALILSLWPCIIDDYRTIPLFYLAFGIFGWSSSYISGRALDNYGIAPIVKTNLIIHIFNGILLFFASNFFYIFNQTYSQVPYASLIFWLATAGCAIIDANLNTIINTHIAIHNQHQLGLAYTVYRLVSGLTSGLISGLAVAR